MALNFGPDDSGGDVDSELFLATIRDVDVDLAGAIWSAWIERLQN